ncbi:MAG: 2OG-Fe(II) oxygenase [Magnetococcales bacterium]|nr:2OG-Fe(II) oxygenase [Magnetococcales bacterium]
MVLSSTVCKEVKSDQNHKAIADGLLTQGFCSISDYLNPAECQNLTLEMEALEKAGSFRPAYVGQGDKLQIAAKIRQSSLLWLSSNYAAQASYKVKMAQLSNELNKQLFLGLRSSESFFALYNPGDYYKIHWDNFQHLSPRKVTVVLYLNQNWNPKDGGQLHLFAPDETTIIATVQPEAGTLACFLSGDFPHSVVVASRRRVAIPSWLRADDPIIL